MSLETYISSHYNLTIHTSFTQATLLSVISSGRRWGKGVTLKEHKSDGETTKTEWSWDNVVRTCLSVSDCSWVNFWLECWLTKSMCFCFSLTIVSRPIGVEKTYSSWKMIARAWWLVSLSSRLLRRPRIWGREDVELKKKQRDTHAVKCKRRKAVSKAVTKCHWNAQVPLFLLIKPHFLLKWFKINVCEDLLNVPWQAPASCVRNGTALLVFVIHSLHTP